MQRSIRLNVVNVNLSKSKRNTPCFILKFFFSVWSFLDLRNNESPYKHIHSHKTGNKRQNEQVT